MGDATSRTESVCRGMSMSVSCRLSALLLASAMPLASQAALPEERIEPSINAELKQHTQHFVQKLYKVVCRYGSMSLIDLALSARISS